VSRPLALALVAVGILVAAAMSAGDSRAAAPPTFDNGEWVVTRLEGAGIPERAFKVRVDGEPTGRTKLLGLASRIGRDSFPQVLVIAASGYLRLKPGADPDPPLPFGQSLVLGPAVFASSAEFPQPALFSNPQLQRVNVSTSQLRRDGTGTLSIRLIARDTGLPEASTKSNQLMDLSWTVSLSEPTAKRTRIRVGGRFEFTQRTMPDPTRTTERQSFRLLQVSSMFIDDDRHDVDVLRYRTADGLVRLAYEPGQAGSLLPASPLPLTSDSPVLDSLHTDDRGAPNGNTPSYRITILKARGPLTGPLTPRAYFAPSDDLNDDNLGLWIHRRPTETIRRGAEGTIAFSVTATADPPPAPRVRTRAWRGQPERWP
jgi:hypothetical protein